ncbi:1-aminocyclopropane-1-carboxylate oxidase homolog 1-like [Triticum urartu]|nr:1-aminocyclopropane-1-carboxylate oxidase homolog 1-like [Triticum urartu]
MAGTRDDYDVTAALDEFYASRTGVCGLVESGVTIVPPLFLAPNSPPPPPLGTTNFIIPTIDLSLPRSVIVPLVHAAARTCGIFYVTNHGVPADVIDSALSAVRAFHELPPAVRSAFYTLAPVGGVSFSTYRNDRPRQAARPDAIPVLPWRDSLTISLAPPGPHMGHFPASCRDPLLEYHRVMAEFGKKKIGALLSEALGVGAEWLEKTMQMEAASMASHYYPPCPEPAKVIGGMDHTDPFLFTVLVQDAVGGLVVHVDHGEWIDVPPVAGTLLINITELLKVFSNDEYISIDHRVRVKSMKESRVSIALFFNPSDSHIIEPLPELVTADKPRRYRSFTMTEFMESRKGKFGNGSSSIQQFALTSEPSS